MSTAFEYRILNWRGSTLHMVEPDLIAWGRIGFRLVTVTDVIDNNPPLREVTAFLERAYDPETEQPLEENYQPDER